MILKRDLPYSKLTSTKKKERRYTDVYALNPKIHATAYANNIQDVLTGYGQTINKYQHGEVHGVALMGMGH